LIACPSSNPSRNKDGIRIETAERRGNDSAGIDDLAFHGGGDENTEIRN
jgi:hypothetical protein